MKLSSGGSLPPVGNEASENLGKRTSAETRMLTTSLGESGEQYPYACSWALSKDSEIQGLIVRSKGKAFEDYKIDFYNNHKLRGFKLVSDTEIDGIPCKGGKKDYIILYFDGKLGECTLSKDFVSEDEVFLADTRVMIRKEGKVYYKDNSPFIIDFYMNLDE